MESTWFSVMLLTEIHARKQIFFCRILQRRSLYDRRS